jgi:hypothetical protein
VTSTITIIPPTTTPTPTETRVPVLRKLITINAHLIAGPNPLETLTFKIICTLLVIGAVGMIFYAWGPDEQSEDHDKKKDS